MKLIKKDYTVNYKMLPRGAKFLLHDELYIKIDDQGAIWITEGDVVLLDDCKVTPVKIEEVKYSVISK